MANEEQLSILKQGVQVWNKWCAEKSLTNVDLSGADLRDLDLNYAILDGADLNHSNLNGVDLSFADLRQANLSYASINKASLQEAQLTGVNCYKSNLNSTSLWGTTLRFADLSDADLTNADLFAADLNHTKLIGSNFFHVRLGSTNFAFNDLSKIIHIDKANHDRASSIGMDTIILSKGNIPDAFLRGCGLSDVDIEYAKLSNPDLSNEEIVKIQYRIYDLRATQAIQISPLFISYSHSDSAFVDEIEIQLNNKGIRFWRDIHDMKSGRMEKQIDSAMRLNPTVLLILSKDSLQSDWVEHEVRTARVLEKEMKKDVLCPIALDDSWKNSTWTKRIMEQVMEYNILDFSEWKDTSKFGNAFNKLIDGLELFYK